MISNCFPDNAEGVAVDTHVQRIVRRLGLSRSWEPMKIEQDLLKVIDRSEWNHLTHLLIDHGRAVCCAPRPSCDSTPMRPSIRSMMRRQITRPRPVPP